MKKLALGLVGIFLVALSACTTAPSPGRTVFLGERSVDFHADHDTIFVGDYKGNFHSVYFKVENNNIEVFNMVIVYGDGERERIDTRFVFDADTRSRTIALDGWKRHIRTIDFSYKTVGDWVGGRAHILVYGIR